MIRKKLFRLLVFGLILSVFSILLSLNNINQYNIRRRKINAINKIQESKDYNLSSSFGKIPFYANEKVASTQSKDSDERYRLLRNHEPAQSITRKIPDVALNESNKEIPNLKSLQLTAIINSYVTSNETKIIITQEKEQKNIFTKKVPEYTSNSKLIKTDEKEQSENIFPTTTIYLRPKIIYLKTLNLTSCVEASDCLKSKAVRWKMFIFVKTAAKFAKRRELVRESWGSVKYVEGGLFTTIFVMGRTNSSYQEMVEEESRRYNDILQVDVLDNYLNVTRKTLASMQWASEHLDENDFFSSADDDMSINMGKLQERIDAYIAETKKKKWPEFPILCGYKKMLKAGKLPIREHDQKNYISVKDYKWTVWPNFCLGGMYTTSVNVARQLYEISRITTPLLSTDDVWITGIIRCRLGMPESMIIRLYPSIAAHLNGNEELDDKKMKDRLHIMQNEAFVNTKSKSTCSC